MFPDGEGAVGLHFMLADDKPAADTPGGKTPQHSGPAPPDKEGSAGMKE